MLVSGRRFKIWEYWVSHAQLVVRSLGDLRCAPGTPGARNLDLCFVAVDYVELPTLLEGLEIASIGAEDRERAMKALGRPVADEHLFVLLSDGRRHIVVAGGLFIQENDMEFNETSVERAQPRRN